MHAAVDAGRASRLEVSRSKNREAQQRFRDRQRARKQDAEGRYSEFNEELERLALENDELAGENLIMEKVLAVREAIVHAFHQASAAQAPRPPQAGPADAGAELAALQTAGAGLARAMEALPEVQDMETTPAGGGDAGAGPPPAAAAAAPSPALGGGAAADRQAAQSATLGAICACEGVRAAEAPTSLLAAHGEAGVALDGAALQGAASVPPASDTEMAEAIQEMTEPAQLVQYWQSWTLDLKASWEAAEAASFAGAPAAALDASMQKMTQIWWHTAHLKPAFLTQLTYAALPKEAAQQAKWAEIAAKILPEMSADSVAVMRRAWHNYSKRLAKAAIVAESSLAKLRSLEVPGGDPGAMQPAAAAGLALAEMCASVGAAVQAEFEASMEFIAEQAPATTMLQKAYINYAAIPHMPDVVAIVYHVLRLAQPSTGESDSPAPAQTSLGVTPV